MELTFERSRFMKAALLFALLIGLCGCTSAVGFGDDDNGLGVRSSVAKDGKILMLEPTDGNGKPK